MIDIITTGDGSHSLFHRELNETYHSTHGAIQESLHVFINHGLVRALEGTQGKIHVLEIGFGTGLNALLTMKEAVERKRSLSYTTVEKYPLEQAVVDRLNYTEMLRWPAGRHWLKQIHAAPWGEQVQIDTGFTLEKMKVDLLELPNLGTNRYDLVYYDAFAPGKQPDMWSLPVLAAVKGSMRAGGILSTYCAQGRFKRDLKRLGFQVEVLPGPPGKKEMVRAVS